MTDAPETLEITETQVSEYLKQNPDFFEGHDHLLESLQLPHSSGSAVSLVERQVALLRERNIEMRNRLSNLLENARENDRLFEKTKRLVLSLLESDSLRTCCDSLVDLFNDDFGIQYTTLIIHGNPEQLSAGKAKVVPLQKLDSKIGQLIKRGDALCGQFEKDEVEALFPNHADAIGSMALVPLVGAGPLGVLAIANRDPDYYRSSMGTLFLGYIAEVLNRVLPNHLPR